MQSTISGLINKYHKRNMQTRSKYLKYKRIFTGTTVSFTQLNQQQNSQFFHHKKKIKNRSLKREQK